MSVNSTNPGTLFGGTWTQISGRFLYCTTTSKTTGGSTTTGSTTLTVDQMPSHIHKMPAWNHNAGSYTVNSAKLTYSDYGTSVWPAESQQWQQEYVGGGQGHTHSQNLPPYFTVYCWYRVS